MKKFNLTLILILFALTIFTSCQDEVIEVTEPSSEETIVAGSSLATAMMRTATFDGSADNIIDSANCLSVELPVTVVVNGVEIIIDSEEDYDLIEAVFDEFDNDNDVLEIQFPIVIILSDYSEITINSYDELEAFVAECSGENEVDDDIECIDFVYPITISIYNANFQVIDTVVIQSDEQLYFFIEELDGGVLASINFPITLVLSSGDEIVVNNNSELQAAIENADGTCDEDDDNDYNDDDIVDCDFNMAGLASYLMECSVEAYFYSSANDLINMLDLSFDENTVIVNGEPAVTEIVDWTLSESADGYVLTISGLQTFTTLNGTWLLEGCNGEHVYFSFDGVTMELEHNCQATPFDCFSDMSVTACDYDGDDIATFELETLVLGNVLCEADFTPSFHLTMEDAQNNTNPIAAPNSFENTSNPQTIYLRIESNSGNFEVYEIQLIIASCVPDCTELDVDGYLQECVWNIVNFNGDDNLIEFDLDFMANQGLVVTGAGLNLQGTWSTSQSANGGVEVVIDGIAGPNIQAINGSWVIVDCNPDRLEMVMGDNTMVIEQNCNVNNDPLGCLEAGTIVLCDENNDGVEVFNLYEGLSEISGCTVNSTVVVSYHTSLEDAQNNTNPLSSVTTYTNISNPQTIYVRVELQNDPSQYEILEMGLSLQDCSGSGSVDDLQNTIIDGTWIVASYIDSGSNNTSVYSNYTLTFYSNGSVVATDGGSSTFEGTWEAFLDSNNDLKLLLDFGDNAPFNEFNDDWLVIDLQTNRIELYDLSGGDNTEDFLVFERI